ncbi:hypothetical protein ACFQE8_10620 [Salinirubellus sp. GCM10025818]|uniref:hypothetical protein n=1 Tax=Salinirubellus TaxID=2162630 RepID=UPI0030D2F00A
MTGVEWRRLLDSLGVDEPAVGQVAEAYADATDISVSQAYERVEAALDAGELVGKDTGGMFPGVAAASEESPETLGVEDGTIGSNPTPDPQRTPSLTTESFASADFTEVEPDTYPPALLIREQWMGRRGKLPFAPWSSRNHPDADEEKDARWKWGLEANYTDGETVRLAEDDPRLDGRVFIQLESDPFAFVDGDDVRCPETGEVHPEFVRLLEAFGFTYADVSTSGTGAHAYYRGELPNGMSQAVFDIDTEPWGANDTPPTIEIYAGKHVNVATGDHVVGTPLEVAEWDADALRTVLEEYEALRAEPEVHHDTDRDREDLAEYEPTVTAIDETTEEMRDVLKAVDHLRPSDLPLRARKVGEDGTGWEQWDPSSYRTSSGNDSLHRPAGEAVFYDHKHGEGFGVLSLFAAEEGILSMPWDRLVGDEWWAAVDAAREAGAPIPEYVGGKEVDAEHVAVLPTAVRDLTTATSGWDWRHAARQGDDALTVESARERTVRAIASAYERGDRVLVEALPTMGKSYGAIEAAADTGKQVTVLTGRGHKEQYQQFRDWCDEHGLSHYTLPSFTRDCLTANGEHGEEWADTVRGWYNRGATPKEIHRSAEYVLDRPLPCQEHEGQRCPYASKWDFHPTEYDVLIGHYSHAHKPKVTTGRTVVFDEFPDAYETLLGPELQGAVSYWLETTDNVPFDSYTDLLENRDDERRRADALLWFDEHGVDSEETDVFDDASAHAAAPLAVFTLLASDDLENGVERADLEDAGVGVFNRARGSVSLLRPPALKYASGVVALDGTPIKRMWELTLGERLNHRQVLQGEERAEYIRDALNLNLVRTTEWIKPYNSADHVNGEQDAALLEAIAEQHGERPSVITTSAAEVEYDAAGILDLVEETKHYGNVLGSNEFDDTRLGAVIGSNHYGDGYIKKWGAYAGEPVERNGGKGAELSYGPFGDRVLTHMREHDTLQAAMRFGRDGNGAVVYVHTDTLPEWVPTAGEGRVLKVWSDGMRQVLDAASGLTSWRTANIVDHPHVTIGERQVREHLNTLAARGYLARTVEGRGYVWRDDGLHRVSDHGEVELGVVEDEETVAEVSRISTYTWDFRSFVTNPRDTISETSDHEYGELIHDTDDMFPGTPPPS